jgi:hypothetical protein
MSTHSCPVGQTAVYRAYREGGVGSAALRDAQLAAIRAVSA